MIILFFDKQNFRRDTKNFPSKFEILPPKNFPFFNRKSNLLRKQTFSEKKRILHAKFDFLCA